MSESYDFLDPDRPEKVQRRIEAKEETEVSQRQRLLEKYPELRDERFRMEDIDIEDFPEVRNRAQVVDTNCSNTEKVAESDTDNVNTTVLDKVVSFFRGVFK